MSKLYTLRNKSLFLWHHVVLVVEVAEHVDEGQAVHDDWDHDEFGEVTPWIQ